MLVNVNIVAPFLSTQTLFYANRLPQWLPQNNKNDLRRITKAPKIMTTGPHGTAEDKRTTYNEITTAYNEVLISTSEC